MQYRDRCLIAASLQYQPTSLMLIMLLLDMHRQNKKDPFFYTNEPQKWLRLDPFTDGCLLCHICFPLVVSWGFSPSSSHRIIQGPPTSSFPLLSQRQTLGASQEESIKTTGMGKENFLSSSPASTITHWRGSPRETQFLFLVCMKRLQRCMGAWEGVAVQEPVLSPSFCYLAIETQTLLLQVQKASSSSSKSPAGSIEFHSLLHQ